MYWGRGPSAVSVRRRFEVLKVKRLIAAVSPFVKSRAPLEDNSMTVMSTIMVRSAMCGHAV